MKDRIPTTRPPDDFVSQEDERLFAYVDTLRLAVKEKVATESQRGSSLAEIVVLVREMVRLAEQDAHRPHPVPPHAFRTISRQALAWCIESYRPVEIAAGDQLGPRSDPLAQSNAFDRAGVPANRFPDRSTN